jgi:mono/diheme cytochrome c family protein
VAGIALTFVAVVCASGLTQPARAADAARGRLLYESRCSGCHDQSVHRREPLRAKTIDEVRAYVQRWNRDLRIGWKDSEVDDVTLYLNGAHYNYPCTDASCVDRRAMLAPAAQR